MNRWWNIGGRSGKFCAEGVTQDRQEGEEEEEIYFRQCRSTRMKAFISLISSPVHGVAVCASSLHHNVCFSYVKPLGKWRPTPSGAGPWYFLCVMMNRESMNECVTLTTLRVLVLIVQAEIPRNKICYFLFDTQCVRGMKEKIQKYRIRRFCLQHRHRRRHRRPFMILSLITLLA